MVVFFFHGKPFVQRHRNKSQTSPPSLPTRRIQGKPSGILEELGFGAEFRRDPGFRTNRSCHFGDTKSQTRNEPMEFIPVFMENTQGENCLKCDHGIPNPRRESWESADPKPGQAQGFIPRGNSVNKPLIQRENSGEFPWDWNLGASPHNKSHFSLGIFPKFPSIQTLCPVFPISSRCDPAKQKIQELSLFSLRLGSFSRPGISWKAFPELSHPGIPPGALQVLPGPSQIRVLGIHCTPVSFSSWIQNPWNEEFPLIPGSAPRNSKQGWGKSKTGAENLGILGILDQKLHLESAHSLKIQGFPHFSAIWDEISQILGRRRAENSGCFGKVFPCSRILGTIPKIGIFKAEFSGWESSKWKNSKDFFFP